jgi:hypothetical protein
VLATSLLATALLAIPVLVGRVLAALAPTTRLLAAFVLVIGVPATFRRRCVRPIGALAPLVSTAAALRSLVYGGPLLPLAVPVRPACALVPGPFMPEPRRRSCGRMSRRGAVLVGGTTVVVDGLALLVGRMLAVPVLAILPGTLLPHRLPATELRPHSGLRRAVAGHRCRSAVDVSGGKRAAPEVSGRRGRSFDRCCSGHGAFS